MPKNVALGSSQATYLLTHTLVSRPMAVTCGHDLTAWDGTPLEAANRLFDVFNDTIVNGMDSNVTFTGVDLFIGNGIAPSGSVQSTRAPQPGEAAGNYPPPNSALLVRKNTATFGRHGTGRLFMPFMVPEASVDEGGNVDGVIVTAVQNQVDLWYAELLAEDVGGNGTLRAVINTSTLDPNVAGVAIPITSFAVQGKMATQRRRMRR